MSESEAASNDKHDDDELYSSQDHEFIVQVARHADGNGSIEVRFDTDNGEDELVRDKEIKEQDVKIDSEVSERKEPTRSLPSVRLTRLSARWTSTSIAFFEIVPKLNALNFKFASNDLIDRMVVYANMVSTKKKEFDDGETKVTEYFLPFDELPVAASKIGRSTQTLKAAEVMGRSSLGALVSEYEAFIANLLEIFSEVMPAAFVTDEDQISVGELTKFDSIEEAKAALLTKKIEDLLHSKSHTQVLTWIGEKFKVNLLSDADIIAEFTEICQRRHLLTHAGGIVNQRYLSACKLAGCKWEELPKLGERVSIDSKYLRRATARVFQVGFFTLHVLWQKLLSKDYEKSCTCILSTSHDFLENELTKMCRRVCDFVLGSNKKPSERICAYLTVNKALSFKNDKEIEDIEKNRQIDIVLSSRDWSIISPTLQLALACIRGDHSNLESLAESAANDGVSYLDANTWVVFRPVREKHEFISKFRKAKTENRTLFLSQPEKAK